MQQKQTFDGFGPVGHIVARAIDGFGLALGGRGGNGGNGTPRDGNLTTKKSLLGHCIISQKTI